jgi:hypothetical protein
MESRTPTAVSPLVLLERSDVGLVPLDARRHVVGMNDFARRVLPAGEKPPCDRFMLALAPGSSQAQVAFMPASTGPGDGALVAVAMSDDMPDLPPQAASRCSGS